MDALFIVPVAMTVINGILAHHRGRNWFCYGILTPVLVFVVGMCVVDKAGTLGTMLATFLDLLITPFMVTGIILALGRRHVIVAT